MVLARAMASNSSAMQSCGSIWMVYGLKGRPRRSSTTPREKASQSKSGQAERWAL
jgi:hypothetical protein